jgi:uncharacterized repeat protein (TIGR03917 family)
VSTDADQAGDPAAASSEVALLPWGTDAWALTVPPGTDTKALFQAVARMPGGLRFVEAFGEVEVILVYRANEPEGTRRGEVGSVVRAVLDVDPTVGPVGGRRWMTEGERQAYLAGKADLADAMLREVVSSAVPLQRFPAAPGAVPD